MAMPKNVTLTRDGGHYWRAVTFRVVAGWLLFPFVLVALGIALVNPLWFRQDLFNWTVSKLNNLTRWLNYRQYAIYLGTDPAVWHRLKGDIN